MSLLDARPSRIEVTVATAASGYAVLLAVSTRIWDYDIWGALVVGPVLFGISIPALRRIAERDRLSGIYPLLVAALGVKLLMALPRWAMAFALYDGAADAARYDTAGRAVAPLYRQLIFPMAEIAGGPGTQMIASITGGVYAVIGPSLLGGFVVFSWLGFWGLLGCYRAARVAMPGLDFRRYALFLFFLPSMVFWPSSIGKEAVVTLAIGSAAYGAARLFTGRLSGLGWILPGLSLALLTRPHIAGLLATSIAVAYLFRTPNRRTMLTPLARAGLATVVAALGLFVAVQAAESLGVEDAESAAQVLSERAGNTSQGGSEFQASAIQGPQDVPQALLTVLYRPYPWEADNAQMLVAAAEGTLLLAVTLLSARRIVTAVGKWRVPYMLMSVIFLLGFLYAFSAFGNFGILARQRVQALPFLLVPVCMAPRPRTPPGAATPRSQNPFPVRSSPS